MGTAESSQSSEVGAITGLTGQSSFHRQSPNVARLIRSENSSKMEYEFPISDVPTSSSSHHHHHGGGGGPTNHSIISSTNTRHGQSSSAISTSQQSQQHLNHSGQHLGHNDNLNRSKIQSNQSSNIWFSLASCFGCRTRGANDSSINSLRDKVHAIRIVRASNDLTPAVFDSHYNIITLEQLRECDNNASGNMNSLPNDTTDPLPSQNPNPGVSAQNGNGSVTASSASASAGSSKKDNNQRIKKKKKKRGTSANYASRSMGSDDDDEGSGRT